MDIADDERGSATPAQDAESRQLETYSCGHEVVGASLATADGERLEVERRESADTVMPVPSDEDAS